MSLFFGSRLNANTTDNICSILFDSVISGICAKSIQHFVNLVCKLWWIVTNRRQPYFTFQKSLANLEVYLPQFYSTGTNKDRWNVGLYSDASTAIMW